MAGSLVWSLIFDTYFCANKQIIGIATPTIFLFMTRLKLIEVKYIVAAQMIVIACLLGMTDEFDTTTNILRNNIDVTVARREVWSSVDDKLSILDIFCWIQSSSTKASESKSSILNKLHQLVRKFLRKQSHILFELWLGTSAAYETID